MTEDQWLTSQEPQQMLGWLSHSWTRSDRKLRLFGVACCRRVRTLTRSQWSRKLLAAAEQYFDMPGDVTLMDLFQSRRPLDRYDAQVMSPAVRAVAQATRRHGFALSPATLCAEAAGYTARAARRPETEHVAQAAILRDIFGPLPFRAVHLEPAWLEWNGGAVKKLAQSAYDGRELPSGKLDSGRLAVLADALEEAGCPDEEILLHLRRQGAVHVRGCWVVDLLLAKKTEQGRQA